MFYLEEHLDPDGVGGHHVARAVPGDPAQILDIVTMREKPGAGMRKL